MLSIEQIKKQYGSDTHRFERDLLREYLQYLILEIIFSSNIATKLSFLGGTCLRIVYGLKRFSEDLDFDNKNLSSDEFLSLAERIEKELTLQGFNVQTTVTERKAIHCHVRFSDILFENKLSNIKTEKIDIQIDTFDQGYEYESEVYLLNKFDVFKQIRVTPKSIILSQKLWTITQRSRAKGRDYYDILFLLQNTKPDMGFLASKFGTSDWNTVKNMILEKIKGVDLESMRRDVQPFLINMEEGERVLLFREYLKQLGF